MKIIKNNIKFLLCQKIRMNVEYILKKGIIGYN